MSKKAIISKSDLNNIIYGQSTVYVRYRLVSEDKNRFSAWTPIFSLTPSMTYISDLTATKSLILGLA
jgi:hypothetical protein